MLRTCVAVMVAHFVASPTWLPWGSFSIRSDSLSICYINFTEGRRHLLCIGILRIRELYSTGEFFLEKSF